MRQDDASRSHRRRVHQSSGKCCGGRAAASVGRTAKCRSAKRLRGERVNSDSAHVVAAWCIDCRAESSGARREGRAVGFPSSCSSKCSGSRAPVVERGRRSSNDRAAAHEIAAFSSGRTGPQCTPGLRQGLSIPRVRTRNGSTRPGLGEWGGRRPARAGPDVVLREIVGDQAAPNSHRHCRSSGFSQQADGGTPSAA